MIVLEVVFDARIKIYAYRVVELELDSCTGIDGEYRALDLGFEVQRFSRHTVSVACAKFTSASGKEVESERLEVERLVVDVKRYAYVLHIVQNESVDRHRSVSGVVCARESPFQESVGQAGSGVEMMAELNLDPESKG